MDSLYTVLQASQATGIARQTIRSYTGIYERFLSTEATPEKGVERRLTESDLRVLAFVSSYTSAGRTHEQAIQALQDGELDAFEWMPPETAQDAPQDAEPSNEALIPVSRLQSAQALVLDAQQREHAIAEQLADAQTELQSLHEQLGQARGELDGWKAARTRPAWLKWLIGG